MKKVLLFIIIVNLNIYSNSNNLKDSNVIKRQVTELDSLYKFSLLNLLQDVSQYQNNDIWRNNIAYTRISAELCDQEKNYLKNRDLITKKKLEHLLSKKLNTNSSLRIALCLSGGGYRALVSSLGYLIGLKYSGLLDTITYITSVSGSAWGLASWYSHNLDLVNFSNLIKKQISKAIYYNFDSQLLIENVMHKLFWNHKINLVGIWGVLLASTFFNDNYLSRTINNNSFRRLFKTSIPKLSQLQEKIKDSSMPMPIFSAVMVERGYDWVEFSPYEIGITSLNTYIPSWGVSRDFKHGESINNCPEAGLDYLMGIWGSAFTASLSELLEIYGKAIPSFLFQILDTITVPEGPWANMRISPATLPNFAYSIPGHPLKNYKYMTLIDGGINCNLPVAPILKKNREIDIAIIVDASGSVETAQELKRAEKYAATYGITLPKISYDNMKPVNIFKDFDADIPVIIYMPLIKNPGYSEDFDPIKCLKESYCSTFNLKYTAQQFDELIGLGQYNLVTSLREIVGVIEELLLNKDLIKQNY